MAQRRASSAGLPAPRGASSGALCGTFRSTVEGREIKGAVSARARGETRQAQAGEPEAKKETRKKDDDANSTN